MRKRNGGAAIYPGLQIGFLAGETALARDRDDVERSPRGNPGGYVRSYPRLFTFWYIRSLQWSVPW
jgi:hypothetical protein